MHNHGSLCHSISFLSHFSRTLSQERLDSTPGQSTHGNPWPVFSRFFDSFLSATSWCYAIYASFMPHLCNVRKLLRGLCQAASPTFQPSPAVLPPRPCFPRITAIAAESSELLRVDKAPWTGLWSSPWVDRSPNPRGPKGVPWSAMLAPNHQELTLGSLR